MFCMKMKYVVIINHFQGNSKKFRGTMLNRGEILEIGGRKFSTVLWDYGLN